MLSNSLTKLRDQMVRELLLSNTAALFSVWNSSLILQIELILLINR